MSLQWGTAEFSPTTDAVAVDHAGVAVTAVIHDEYTVLSWAVNIKGANWAMTEQIAKVAAEELGRWLREFGDFEVTPDVG